MREASSIPAVTYAKAGYTISTDQELLDVAIIHQYLSEQSYWAQGIGREQVEQSLRFSLCFGVYRDDTVPLLQVGMARIITDYSTYAYLSDVFILPEFQGQGLGKWLVTTIFEHPDLQSIRRWALYTKDAHELYRRFGFDAEEVPQRYMTFCPQRTQSTPPDVERR